MAIPLSSPSVIPKESDILAEGETSRVFPQKEQGSCVLAVERACAKSCPENKERV